jgi:hypothetical protein
MFGFMKSLTVILLVVVLNVLGDVCLSYGMRQVGEVHPLHPVSVLLVGLRMFANPWVALAITWLVHQKLCSQFYKELAPYLYLATLYTE